MSNDYSLSVVLPVDCELLSTSKGRESCPVDGYTYYLCPVWECY